MKLSYAWYEKGLFSDGLIADKLNGYVMTQPDGTLQHFRTKRWLKRGGPHPFSRDSVREILTRPFYTGQLPYYGKNQRGTRLKRNSVTFWSQGQHPPLISRDLYDRCQQVRRLFGSRPRTSQVRKRRDYPLSDFLYCSQRGRRMIGLYRRGERHYYCATPLGHCGMCTQPSVNAETIENEVVAFLMQIKWPSNWREQLVSQAAQDEAILREEHRIIRELERVADFATNWQGARNLIEQKSLLRLAITRLIVRGRSIKEIQISRDLSRLLMDLHRVNGSEDESEDPVYRLSHGDSQVEIKLSA